MPIYRGPDWVWAGLSGGICSSYDWFSPLYLGIPGLCGRGGRGDHDCAGGGHGPGLEVIFIRNERWAWGAGGDCGRDWAIGIESAD